jgi:hypothetical protein
VDRLVVWPMGEEGRYDPKGAVPRRKYRWLPGAVPLPQLRMQTHRVRAEVALTVQLWILDRWHPLWAGGAVQREQLPTSTLPSIERPLDLAAWVGPAGGFALLAVRNDFVDDGWTTTLRWVPITEAQRWDVRTTQPTKTGPPRIVATDWPDPITPWGYLRQEPSPAAEIVGEVRNRTRVSVLEEGDDFTRVLVTSGGARGNVGYLPNAWLSELRPR